MLSRKDKRKQGVIPAGVYVDRNLKADKFDDRDRMYCPSGSASIPDVFTINNLPSIENQYSINSCVANAAVSVLEIMLNNNNAFRDLSRLFLYYILRDGTVYAGRDDGAELRDGFKVVNKLGIVDEASYPYEISKVNHRPSDDIFKLAEPHKAFNYERVLFNVNGRDPRSLINIKHAVAEGYPVLFSMLNCRDFQSLRNNTINYKYDSNKHVGMHGMVVCGYNDVEEYFYIRNSWGKDWGEDGYCKIRYAVFQQILMDAWICKSFDGYGVPVEPVIIPPTPVTPPVIVTPPLIVDPVIVTPVEPVVINKITEIVSIENTDIELLDTRFKAIDINDYVNIKTVGTPSINFKWENYSGSSNIAKLSDADTKKTLVEVNNTGKYEITCNIYDGTNYAGKVHFYLEYKRSIILTDIKAPVIDYVVNYDGLPLEITMDGGIQPYNLVIFKFTKNKELSEFVGSVVHSEQGLGTVYLPTTNLYPDQGKVHTSATLNIQPDEYIKIVVSDARYVLKDSDGDGVTLKNCAASITEVTIEGKHFYKAPPITEEAPLPTVEDIKEPVVTPAVDVKPTFWDKAKMVIKNIIFSITNAWYKLKYRIFN